MYNSTRSIFPAYTGLSDIRVSLPAPPSRSSIARDVEDLWDIRNSEPHINILTDNGVESPLPDDGFNPETNLSEDSDANILVNRGGQYLSPSKRDELLNTLDDIYTDMLVSNMSMSSSDVGQIKEMMKREAIGSLLVYNGSDKDCLIKAYSLIRSLELLIENVVADSTFPETAKSELIDFVKPCQSVRDAILLPNHMIQQRLFGSTESRDNLKRALHLFQLDDNIQEHLRMNSSDDEYSDYQEAILLSELELVNAINDDIRAGLCAQAMDNALRQVVDTVGSPELRQALSATIGCTRTIANNECIKGAKGLRALLGKLKEDLSTIGVNPEYLAKLSAKERKADRLAEMPKQSRPSLSSNPTRGRGHNELMRTAQNIESAQRNLQTYALQQTQQDARLACMVELYTLMCMRDCCLALASGENRLEECASRLYEAILAEANEPWTKFSRLKSSVNKAKSDLKRAQKSRTLETLQRAQSENTISEKKLETLKTLLS